MKRAAAFALAASLCWAISPQWLETILDIAKGDGEEIEAVEARLGRKLDNAQQATMRDGGVAVIPMVGPVFRRANLFTQVSGATSIELLARDFRAAMDDPAVKAICLNVDSPGGEVSGVNELAAMIRASRGSKPIYAYVGHQACSAAYWIASAADKIVIDATSEVGSIGVVAAVANPKADDSKIEIVSTQSPRKRSDPTTESGRALVQEKIDAIADVFISTVADNRGVSTAKVGKDFGRGGTLVGQAAVDAGMVDEVGSFEGTVAALAAAGQARTQRRYSMSAVLSIAAILGMTAGASDEAVIERAREVARDRADLLEACGAPDVATARGTIVGLRETAKTAAETAKTLADLEAKQREGDVVRLLDTEGKRKGIVDPAKRRALLIACGAKEVADPSDPKKTILAGADPKMLASVLAALGPAPKASTIEEPTGSGDLTGDSLVATLSPRERRMAEANGWKPEEYAAHKAKFLAKRRAGESRDDEDDDHEEVRA